MKDIRGKEGPGPVEYAAAFGERFVYGWQSEVMREAWRGSQVAARTCNSSGKTSVVVANFGLAVMAHWPGARVVSTSASWNQIETQLWPVLKMKVSGMAGWEWNKREVRGPVKEIGGKQFQSVWTPFSTDDPKRAEGHHDRTADTRAGQVFCPVAYIIDEAKGVGDGIFDAQGRCRASFKMNVSSPGEDFGAFYDLFYKYAKLWSPFAVDWKQCDHLYGDPVMRKRIEQEIKIKGRNHPLIMSQYFGDFFRAAGYLVFEMDGVRTAMGGLVPKRGVDRAGAFDWSAGGDEQIWGVREGNHVVDMKEFREKNGVALGKLILAEIRRWGLNGSELVFDNGGGGKELIDLLESWGVTGINRYMNNEAAQDSTQYANRYTEDCFERLSLRIKTLGLPRDEKLERQMRERQYVMPNDDSNRRRLEPKEAIRKRGGESPDRLDMLIMLFSKHRSIEQGASDANVMRRTPTRGDAFSDDDDETSPVFGGGWRGDIF